MDEIKKIYSSAISKCAPNNNNGDNISFYWKIIIYIYIFSFFVLMISGWLFYSWVITSETIIPKTKNIRSEITMDNVNRVKELIQERKSKLEKAMNSNVHAVDMK